MFEYENEFLTQGYSHIAGIDEAGRGPLAGPVVCAIAMMPLEKDKIIDVSIEGCRCCSVGSICIRMGSKSIGLIEYKGKEFG